MDPVWSSEIDEILGVGRPLPWGTAGWALERSDALGALGKLAAVGVAVIAGDVWELVEGRLTHTGDTWGWRRQPDQSDSDFVTGGVVKARNYISTYQPRERVILFELVPDAESEDARNEKAVRKLLGPSSGGRPAK